MNKSTKIAVVAGILLVIGGIWAVKNIEFGSDKQVAETEAVTETAPVTESVTTETEVAQDGASTEETTDEATEPAGETADDGNSAPENIDLTLEWTTHDFDELVGYNKPMILDFGAEDCGPCQIMAPDLEAFHAENKERATIQFYDVWKKPELAQGYPIQVVPTQLFFMPDGTPYDPGDRMSDSGIRFTLFHHRETDEHGLTAHAGILTKEQLERILEDMESQIQ